MKRMAIVFVLAFWWYANIAGLYADWYTEFPAREYRDRRKRVAMFICFGALLPGPMFATGFYVDGFVWDWWRYPIIECKGRWCK